DLTNPVMLLIILWLVAKAVKEQRSQGVAKRAEVVLMLQSRWQDPSFRHISTLLADDSPDLREVSEAEKDRYLGFFSEVFLVRNSGVMNNDVTVCLFGQLAARCWESESFWHGLDRELPLRVAFQDFAEQMSE